MPFAHPFALKSMFLFRSILLFLRTESERREAAKQMDCEVKMKREVMKGWRKESEDGNGGEDRV